MQLAKQAQIRTRKSYLATDKRCAAAMTRIRLLLLVFLFVVPLECLDELLAVAVFLRLPAKRKVRMDWDLRLRDLRDVLEALPLDLILHNAASQLALCQNLQSRDAYFNFEHRNRGRDGDLELEFTMVI